MMKTRKLLCMILVVAAISCFSSMLSFAFSATSSNALMATSSNAWPMDDFVELDDFDSIERPVLMNAGAALYIGGKADSLKEGIVLAAEMIDSGKALGTLHKLIEVSNRPDSAEVTA